MKKSKIWVYRVEKFYRISNVPTLSDWKKNEQIVPATSCSTSQTVMISNNSIMNRIHRIKQVYKSFKFENP